MDLNKLVILSAKGWKDYYALQVVYEWEEIISAVLKIPEDIVTQPLLDKIYNKPINLFLQKFIRNSFLKNYIDITGNYLLRNKRDVTYLSHQLYVIDMPNHYVYQQNSIPIFIDCFKSMANRIPVLCKKNPLLFVTDREVYQQLMQTSIAAKTRFVPLSISDKYFQQAVPKKNIDVLQMGRQNPVLHEWMIRLTKKYPHIQYVYAQKKDEVHAYFSTTTGRLNDLTDTREQFMQFLSRAKISLLSSPGIDGGEVTRTGGYNPVTPRFYESAVNYCYMVGRFPDSPDFIYNEVASVCERPEDYETFEKHILNMLSVPFAMQERYEPFIKKHLTSAIAATIGVEIEKL